MASLPWPRRIFGDTENLLWGKYASGQGRAATEQTGALEKAWSKVSPALAIFSILGMAPNLAP